jgi:hypothetical protein
VLGKVRWEAAIVDEAHRLKSIKSSTRDVIVHQLDIKWMLLLTGARAAGQGQLGRGSWAGAAGQGQLGRALH